MRRGGFLALALGFGALLVAWQRRSRGLAEDTLHAYDHAIFADLFPERIAAIRIDHLVRAEQIRFERDARGTWYITDPIAYPAEADVVEKLVLVLRRERGTLDPAPVLGELGLDPPRAVVELDERGPDGVRTLRVEVGADDVDPRLVAVRVPGHPAAPAGSSGAVLRVSRALSDTLERNLDDWRDTRLTPLDVASVRRFVRRGAQPLDATWHAGAWLTTDHGIRLDPGAMSVLVRCAAEMRVRDFVSEAPSDPASFGLDPPELEIELEDEHGGGCTLRFGQGPLAQRWYAARADIPNVFAVEPTDVALLRRPEEALWDQTLVRLLREMLVRVELERPAGPLVIERAGGAGEGWTVRAEGSAIPADSARVLDLVAGLEKARVAAFVPGLALRDEERVASFALALSDGSRQGADIGPSWSDAAKGVAGRIVRRLGEEACGLVDETLLGLVSTPAAELRSLRAHLVADREVEHVRLARGADEQRYVRDGARWRPHGLDLPPSQAFLDLLDPLLGLRVREWLPPEAGALLDPAVEIELRGSFGAPIAFTLGRDAAGEPTVRLASGAVGRVAEGLVAGALALFEPR